MAATGFGDPFDALDGRALERSATTGSAAATWTGATSRWPAARSSCATRPGTLDGAEVRTQVALPHRHLPRPDPRRGRALLADRLLPLRAARLRVGGRHRDPQRPQRHRAPARPTRAGARRTRRRARSGSTRPPPSTTTRSSSRARPSRSASTASRCGRGRRASRPRRWRSISTRGSRPGWPGRRARRRHAGRPGRRSPAPDRTLRGWPCWSTRCASTRTPGCRSARWCHLVSDASFEELHAFAARLGIPRRFFQGDHYDLPEHLRARALELGAVPGHARASCSRAWPGRAATARVAGRGGG